MSGTETRKDIRKESRSQGLVGAIGGQLVPVVALSKDTPTLFVVCANVLPGLGMKMSLIRWYKAIGCYFRAATSDAHWEHQIIQTLILTFRPWRWKEIRKTNAMLVLRSLLVLGRAEQQFPLLHLPLSILGRMPRRCCQRLRGLGWITLAVQQYTYTGHKEIYGIFSACVQACWLVSFSVIPLLPLFTMLICQHFLFVWVRL